MGVRFMNRRDFLGLVVGFSATSAAVADDRTCRQAKTYRAHCHGVPPTEPDDGSIRPSKKPSAPKPAAPAFKKAGAQPKDATTPTYPPIDVDMCSALSVRDRKNSPICTPR